MNKSSDALLTDILVEFFEVLIHSVLHLRNIYPKAIFERRRTFGVAVYQSIHPELNQYITECLKCVRFLLRERKLYKLVVCFFKPDKTVVEKVVFDVLKLSNISDDDTYLLELQNSFRTLLLQLQMNTANLEPLDEDVSFSLQLHSNENSSTSFLNDPKLQDYDFPWQMVSESFGDIPSAEIVPVYTADTRYVNIQSYYECIRKTASQKSVTADTAS